MVHFNNSIIAAERKRVQSLKVWNACKFLMLTAAVVAMVTYGALA